MRSDSSLRDQKTMNILKTLFKKGDIVTKSHAVLPQFYTPIFKGAGHCPLVHRCIKIIALNTASIKLVAPEGTLSEEVLASPNPNESIGNILEKVVSSLYVAGRAYLIFRPQSKHMYCLDSARVKEEFGELGQIKGYSYYTPKGREFEYIQSNGQCNVLQIKYYDPFNKGLSPCDVVQDSVKLYSSISRSGQAFMDNSARFSGSLIVNADNLTDEEMDDLRKALSDRIGVDNAGKAIILNGNSMRWEQVKTNAKEADYTAIQAFVAREIMQGLGVPPIMLGLADTGFQHYREARLHFWEDTILPLANQLTSSIGRWLGLCCEEDVTIKLNLLDIPALADKIDHRIKIVSHASFISDEEKRKFCGI